MYTPRRDDKGRFFNPWTGFRRGLFDVLRWKLRANPFAGEKKRPPALPRERPDFAALEQTPGDYMVWLGHSTVFIRASGRRIVTDPVFWDVLPPFIRRKTPLPVDPAEIPPVDMVLLSHTHYDHLNNRSVEYLDRRFSPLFVTGPGWGRYMRRHGVENHLELGWWESRAWGPAGLTSLPVQHWSRRGLFDTNRSLWCSWMITSGPRRYYWIGDTGYFDGFAEVGARLGPVDVVLAPIGAYEPRWFMGPYHLTPEEALKVARDVRARVMIPIHWGTFDLSDEPLAQPVERVKEAARRANGPGVVILPHGGSYRP